MKSVYGDPPVLIVPLFLKIYASVMLLAVVVVLGAFALDTPIGSVDLVVITVTAPVLSYLIHLWLAPATAGESENSEL